MAQGRTQRQFTREYKAQAAQHLIMPDRRCAGSSVQVLAAFTLGCARSRLDRDALRRTPSCAGRGTGTRGGASTQRRVAGRHLLSRNG
jgi:hypothetical protein